MKRTEEPLSPYDLVGRRVENAFGRRETIIMTRGCWNYFYWLGFMGYDIRKWVKTIDLDRGPIPLQDALSDGIYWEHERRHREGIHPMEPEWWAATNARATDAG